MKNFNEKLQSWIDGVNAIIVKYYSEHFPNLTPETVSIREGKRYLRIMKPTSIYCFIDKNNGDVLKAAGMKAPAKHARGNIFDESNGLKFMGPHGPAYLR